MFINGVKNFFIDSDGLELQEVVPGVSFNQVRNLVENVGITQSLNDGRLVQLEHQVHQFDYLESQ
jgi:hypothetical protein